MGASTIAADLDAALGAAADPVIVALTGLLKLMLGAFALAFDFPVLLPRWRKVRVFAGYLVAGLLLAYGAAGFLDHLTMVTGLRATPDALGDFAARWHAFFWDPAWLLGGVLLALATRTFARERHPPP